MADIGTGLNAINRTLERHNEIAQKMFDAMQKPENKFIRALEIIVLVAGVLGILSSAEIIRLWIAGG